MGLLVEIAVWLAFGWLLGRLVAWVFPPPFAGPYERWFRRFYAPLLGASGGVALACMEGRLDSRLGALLVFLVVHRHVVVLLFAVAVGRADLWRPDETRGGAGGAERRGLASAEGGGDEQRQGDQCRGEHDGRDENDPERAVFRSHGGEFGVLCRHHQVQPSPELRHGFDGSGP